MGVLALPAAHVNGRLQFSQSKHNMHNDFRCWLVCFRIGVEAVPIALTQLRPFVFPAAREKMEIWSELLGSVCSEKYIKAIYQSHALEIWFLKTWRVSKGNWYLAKHLLILKSDECNLLASVLFYFCSQTFIFIHQVNWPNNHNNQQTSAASPFQIHAQHFGKYWGNISGSDEHILLVYRYF